MKFTLHHSWTFFLVIILSFSCKQQEDLMPAKGNATFSMSTLSRDRSGGRFEQNETPVAVLLSIEDGNGLLVVENKKLSLFAFGNGYVSESLELTEGNYKLVQFQVLNADDVIIYASPMAGSELAKYVNNPLPISFTISKDASTTVTPQVLKVESTDNPVDFGYVNFGFEIVNTDNLFAGKIKTYYTYSLNNECNCYLPGSKVTFTYDDYERLASWDVYANFSSANGYSHNWHSTVEYFTELSYYKETLWSVNPEELQSTKEVYLDQSNKITSIKLFTVDAWGALKLSGTQKYEYNSEGYTVEYLIGNATTGGAKVEYKILNDNAIQIINYDTNGVKYGEAFITYDDQKNPIHDFNPLLTNSESLNNRLKYVSGVYEEVYNNTYSSTGTLLEMIMTASNGTGEKRTFEYY